MTEPENKRRAWNLVVDTAFDEELERLAKLTPEELAEEAKKLGIDPASTLEITEKAIAAAGAAGAGKGAGKGAPVVNLAEARVKRRRIPPWLLLAATFALVAGLGAMNFATVVAYFSPPAPTPTGRETTPLEMAADIRQQGIADCARGDYAGCEQKLDRAKTLDPAGEQSPRIVRGRATILRQKAFVDCAKGYLVRCREQLDAAKGLDPSGEADPRVQEARAAILAGDAGAFEGVKH